MTAKSILVADDNADHQELTRIALRKAACDAEVIFAEDGIAALNVLFKDGEQAREACGSLPAIAILDIKMPFLDGFEVLRRMKQHPRTRDIPVVMFSSCNEAQDVGRAYELGANRFIRKPVSYADLSEMIKELLVYWEKLIES
jgi:two-component system response regulator